MALQGNYSTLCERQQIHTLNIGDGRLTIQQDTYGDKACTVKTLSLRQSGKMSLVNHYKEGESNSLIFETDPSIGVTLWTDKQISYITSIRSQLAKATPEPIDASLTPAEQSDQRRKNQKLTEAQKVGDFVRGQEKNLSDLQVEKLNEHGLGASPLVTFNTRATFKYNIDNGYLEIPSLPVFQKQ